AVGAPAGAGGTGRGNRPPLNAGEHPPSADAADGGGPHQHLAPCVPAGGLMTFRDLWEFELTKRLSSSDTLKLFTPARRQAAINRGAMTFARLTSCCVADCPLGSPLVDGQAWVAVSTPTSAFYGFSPQGLLLRRQ